VYKRENKSKKKKEKINISMNFKDYFQDNNELKPGDVCKNINPDCKHFGSEGIVVKIFDINQKNGEENRIGKAVEYKVSNDGINFKKGDTLTKTLDQLKKT